MTARKLTYLLSVYAALASCNTIKSDSNSRSMGEGQTSSTVLVFGDIQQKDELLTRDIPSFDRNRWDTHSIDTTALTRLNPKKVLDNIKPHDVLQLGDFVDFNNGFELAVTTKSGSSLILKPEYDEWSSVLGFFRTSAPIYPTIGNHETYKRIRFHGVESSEGTYQITAGPGDDATGDRTSQDLRERYDGLLTYFPHLLNASFFNSPSGTYFVVKENYCLLSIDGAALVNKEIDKDNGVPRASIAWSALKPFVTSSIAKCSFQKNGHSLPLKPTIVMIHYPIFSALNPKEQEFRDDVAADIVKTFDDFHVALVLSGHEHLYMRYLEQGYVGAGYEAMRPRETTYVTIANFGVPKDKTHTKLRTIDGDSKAYIRIESPTFAYMNVSKNSIKFTAKTHAGEEWQVSDSFDLSLQPDRSWRRTERRNSFK